MKVTCERCSHVLDIEPPPWVVAAGRPFPLLCSECGNRQMATPSTGLALSEDAGVSGVVGHLDAAGHVDAPTSPSSPVALGEDEDDVVGEVATGAALPSGLILPDDVADVPEPRAEPGAEDGPEPRTERFDEMGAAIDTEDFDPASLPDDDLSDEMPAVPLLAPTPGHLAHAVVTAEPRAAAPSAPASPRFELPPMYEPDDERPSAIGSTAGEFMLRQDGALFDVPDLATLQRWIMEHRVDPDDQITERGGPWTRCGDRADLAVFFAAVERLDTLDDDNQPFLSTASAFRPVSMLSRAEEDNTPTASGAETEETMDEPSVEDYTQESERQATEEAPGMFAAGDYRPVGLSPVFRDERPPARRSASDGLPAPVPEDRFEDPDWDTFTSPSVEEVRSFAPPPPQQPPPPPAADLGAEFLNDAPPASRGSTAARWLFGVGLVLAALLLSLTFPWRPEPAAPAPTPQVRTVAVPEGAPAAVEVAPTPAAVEPTPAAARPTATPAPTPRVVTPTPAERRTPTPAPSARATPTPRPTATPAGSPWSDDPASRTPTPPPPNVDELIEQGWAAIDSGNGTRARELFERALEFRPTDGVANYGMGMAFKELGRDTDARRYLCAARRRVNSFDARDIDGILEAMGATCE